MIEINELALVPVGGGKKLLAAFHHQSSASRHDWTEEDVLFRWRLALFDVRLTPVSTCVFS